MKCTEQISSRDKKKKKQPPIICPKEKNRPTEMIHALSYSHYHMNTVHRFTCD